MNSPRLWISLFALWTAWAAMPAAAADATREFAVEGWVELSENGELLAFEPGGEPPLPPSLLPGVEAELQRIAFKSAVREGEPAPSRSWLTARAVLTPVGDDYGLVIRDSRLGPRPVQREVPRIAPGSRRFLQMVLVFTVDANGRPTDVAAESLAGADRRQLDSAVASLSRWRFEPEQVAGQPVASPMRLVVTFSRSPDDVPTEESRPPAAALPAERPGAPGQDAYAAPVEVFAVPASVPRATRAGARGGT